MRSIALILTTSIIVAAGCGKRPDTNMLELKPRDVVSAVIQEDGGMFRIEITLTEPASKHLAQLTKANLGEKLPLVVAGEVISEPEVREVIAGPKISISGKGKEEAERILQALTK